MNRWESVKLLICRCERVDFVHVCAQRKLAFVQHVSWSFNNVLRTCVSCFKLSKEEIYSFVLYGVWAFTNGLFQQG